MEVLRINGKDKEFPEGIPPTLAKLLDQLGIAQATVVAQIDDTIIEQDAFARTELAAGQSIELLRFVGGG